MKPFDFSHAKQLIGKAVKYIPENHIELVTFVSENRIMISDNYFTYYEFLKNYTFLDGNPCGVEEEYNLSFIEVLQTAQNGDSFIGENLSIIFNFNKNCFSYVNDTYIMLTENVLKDKYKKL